MFDCVLWDWNGTLLDDVAVGVAAMNDMLSRRGLPLLPDREAYREIFTFPVKDYYRAAGLDLEQEPFEALAVEWTELYNRLYPGSGLFPGAQSVLEAMKKWGICQAIVSASQQQALDRQVEELGVGKWFQARLGISDIYAGGKAGIARRYLETRKIRPERALFVGDTLHDWEVAREAGCSCILLAQGHQSRKRLEGAGVPVLESVGEVPFFLETGRRR